MAAVVRPGQRDRRVGQAGHGNALPDAPAQPPLVATEHGLREHQVEGEGQHHEQHHRVAGELGRIGPELALGDAGVAQCRHQRAHQVAAVPDVGVVAVGPGHLHAAQQQREARAQQQPGPELHLRVALGGLRGRDQRGLERRGHLLEHPHEHRLLAGRVGGQWKAWPQGIERPLAVRQPVAGHHHAPAAVRAALVDLVTVDHHRRKLQQHARLVQRGAGARPQAHPQHSVGAQPVNLARHQRLEPRRVHRRDRVDAQLRPQALQHRYRRRCGRGRGDVEGNPRRRRGRRGRSRQRWRWLRMHGHPARQGHHTHHAQKQRRTPPRRRPQRPTQSARRVLPFPSARVHRASLPCNRARAGPRRSPRTGQRR